MDESMYEEIFDGWLRTPDLTIEMPWMLRHSLENFQEMRLMDGDKRREENAQTPFEPMRKSCSLQDLPLRAEELESGSDTVSIPPDRSIDNQNSPLSSPSSDRKSTRSGSLTWEVPVPAILPLPYHAYPETKGAELEELRPESADEIVFRQGSRYKGRSFWISTPTLGDTLDSTRTTFSAPGSFRRHSFFGYPESIRSDLTFDRAPKEQAIGPDAPTFDLQHLPPCRLRKSISTPCFGIRLGATKAPSYLRSPFLGAISPANLQEQSSQQETTNISSAETKVLSSAEIRDCPSQEGDIPENPVISVAKVTNASGSGSYDEPVSDDEKATELQRLPPHCDGTGRAIDERGLQSEKHEELDGEVYQDHSTETRKESSAVHVGSPAPNDAPCHVAEVHEAITPPASVDIVDESSKDVPRRRPKKILRRVPVAPGWPSEGAVVNDSRVKSSSPSNSPVGGHCMDDGATQSQAHAGKRGDCNPRRHQPWKSHETVQDHHKAKTGCAVDIRTASGTGLGTSTDNGLGAGSGTDSGPGTGTGGDARSEVDARRADRVPASSPGPKGNRFDKGNRNRNRNRNQNRAVSNQAATRDQSGFQPSSRNHHGPTANTVANVPALPVAPVAATPSPTTSPAPQVHQSVHSKPTVVAEVARLEPQGSPRQASVAGNLNCDPAPSAAIQSTAAAVISDSAQIMSVETSSPANPGAAASISATDLNAQVSTLAPYRRGSGTSNLHVHNLALAMASYDAGSHATSSRPASMWKTKQAPYVAREDDMIKPVGNWDSSADEAARTPVLGQYRTRIDLRKVREITKLTERLRPRAQGAPQGFAPAMPVHTAGVPVNAGNPNGANGNKSPPPAPAKLAVTNRAPDVAPLRQAATECPEPAKPSVPPHLRRAIVPATPKLLLRNKLPPPTSAPKPTPSTNGTFENLDAHAAKQADVPATNPATAKLNPVDDGATGPSIQSQPKTPSDRSQPESVGRPSPSLKAEKITEVAVGESNSPPAASCDDPAKPDSVPAEFVHQKVPNLTPRHPLIGWDGTWQEAPVDWAGRPLFNNHDRHRLRAMNTWMEERAQEALNNPVTVDTRAPGFETGEALAVGEKELHKPINRRLHDTHLPDDDFTHAKKDGTAAEALEKHQARIRVVERDARTAERESKAERRAYREAVRAAAAKYVPPPNPHTPRANIYLRPAILEDMPKIAELYNHYIAHSVVASERTPMTAHQWQTRWEDAREAKYAFLVAVQSSPRGGGYSRRMSEEVLTGFAYADDYGDRNGAWRCTCEIQFFVAHWQLRAGVGKSLVDRLLAALDPVYNARNAVQFCGGENSLQYEQGGERVVSKIVVGIPFAVKEKADVKWQKEWLTQFGFEEMATFPKVGRKLGKEISIMWLHKETGSIFANGM